MKVVVTNIQRFSLHDGPGIRTTIFLKGCNLKCPWCSNPENIDFNIQKYRTQNEEGAYGYEIELEELKDIILKDKDFFDKKGGVTFSGGEPLLQFNKLTPLLKTLKKRKINICIETSLIAPTEVVDIAIKYVDNFIIDLKILDRNNVKKINGDIEVYIQNLEKIYKRNKNIVFRIPLVPKYTTTDSNIKEILKILRKFRPIRVEIFKLHRLGEKKYNSLGIKMHEFEDITEKEINDIKEKIENLNIIVNYCKI